MRNKDWTRALSTLGVALLVSSCTADTTASDSGSAPSPSETAGAIADASVEEAAPPEADVEPSDDREFRPSQQIIAGENDVEIRYLPGEDGAGIEVHHLHCEDSEALAEKAEYNGDRQPEGWPREWDGTGAMPDPYCHPDYLEIGEWEHLEAHSACWEGLETSTLVDGGQPQDEINESLWEQSQARAAWEPNPPGGTCSEQWAEHEGGDPEDEANVGNVDGS